MIVLRDYQASLLDGLRAAIRNGARRPLATLATGGGKGECLAEVALKHEAKGGVVLIATTRTGLVSDLRKRLRKYGSKARVVTHQAIALAKRLPPDVTMLQCDEGHHVSADEISAVIQARPDVLVIGWTATPMREQGSRGLGDVYDALVLGPSIKELVRQGHLVPCKVIAPSRLLKPGQIAQDPVEAWMQNGRGRQTVVFCSRVKEAIELAASFNARGVRATHVDGTLTKDECARRLADLDDGRVQVVVNVGVTTEGFNCTVVSCIVLARGCNASLYLQMAGRGMRLHPGKEDMVLIDLRGVTHTHGPPDEPREFSLDKGIRRAGAGDVRFCKVCGAVLDKPGPCPDCGLESEPFSVEITGDKLEKYATKKAETPEQRAAYLEKMRGIAREKGYRPGWAEVKYHAIYNEWPKRSIASGR